MRDAAAMLPFVTALLFVPPIVLVFARVDTVFGVPLVVLYLFGVWAVVIGLAFFLSLRLGKPEPSGDGSD